jgi:hypothetical protein
MLLQRHRPTFNKVVGNSDKAVEECVAAAVTALRGGKGPTTLATMHQAMGSLCKLHGVGVATASAVIAAVTDEYCYMGDEALAVSILVHVS